MEVKLKTKHIIMLSKLVSKMELKFDIKGKTQEELGGEIIFALVSNIYKAETEFYTLLGDISGYTQDKVADMEIKDLITEIKTIAEGMISFFK